MTRRSAWLAYLVAIGIAEAALPYAPAATAMIDAAVVVLALTHFGWAQRSPLAVGEPSIRVLPALALVPLLRLLSMTLPVPSFPPVAWLAISMGPLLLAIIASVRLSHMDVIEMGMTRITLDRWTAGAVLLSLPAGLVVGRLAPSQFSVPDSTPMLGLVALVLVAGAAIPEELIFRGVLQPLLGDVVGPAAPALVAMLFAATYLGSGSTAVVLAMLGIGWGYGLTAARTKSIWGALIGHGVLLLTAVFVAPALFT